MSEQTGPGAGHPGTTGGTQTGNQTGYPTGYQDGPRVTGDQMRDVDRLRRSRTDRYVAGVAGGLGRHFDVDPTVVRVLIAVLTFFGGAGVLVYAAVWLFVPEDGSDRAPIDVRPDSRRVVLVVAAALALMIVFGSPFLDGSWGWSFPFPLLVLVLVGVVVLANRQRRDRRAAGPPVPWGTPPAAATAGPSTGPGTGPTPGSATSPTTVPFQEGTAMSSTQTLPVTPAGQAGPPPAGSGPGQAPPAWMPPPAPAYVPPPRPRRTGLVLFWPTLALIAIALGTLGIFDVSGSVPVSAYAALAVGVTGLVLLVGAFVGRPGGLIALGLVTTAALVVTSIVGAATGGSTRDEDVRIAPTSTAGLGNSYDIGTGSIVVDLSGVRDVAALDGRFLAVTAKAGEIRVVLPAGVNAEVAARVRYAGQVDLGTSSRGGFDFSTTRTLTSSTAPGTPTIDLDLATRVGQITVEQR